MLFTYPNTLEEIAVMVGKHYQSLIDNNLPPTTADDLAQSLHEELLAALLNDAAEKELDGTGRGR